MAKIKEILTLAEEAAKKASASPRDWMNYLDTASRVYRYPFSDSLLIHAQRPQATACAELEVWNSKMNRWVNRGARGIALIDDRGPYRKLRYVFDISDTHMVQNGRTPFLWEIQEGHMEDLIDHLTEAYQMNDVMPVDLYEALQEIAEREARESCEDIFRDLLRAADGSNLEELPPEMIRTELQSFLEASTFYTLARRCGLDPMETLSEQDFTAVTDYNTLPVLSLVGQGIYELTEPVLRDIGRTIRQINKESQERSVENTTRTDYNEFNTLKRETAERQIEKNIIQGGIDHGTDISQEGRVPVSESRDRGAGTEHRQIRNAQENISEGEPEPAVSEPFDQREAGQSSAGDREERRGEDGTPDAAAPEAVSGTGQGTGPVEVDSPHEQPEPDGRRERTEGIGIQLTDNTEEDPLTEAEAETASALSLPDFPSVNEQIRAIEEPAAARYAGEISIPADVIDEIIRTGSNQSRSQLRIIYEFMGESSMEEHAKFLQKEYRTGGKGLVIGGKEYSVWFDELGMQVAQGHTVTDNLMNKAFLSWDDIAERTGQLLRQGEYAPQSVLDAARDNAFMEHARVLAYMEKDMAEGVSEIVFADPSMFIGGFNEVEKKIAESLSDPAFLADLNDRLEGLAAAYDEDSDVMRFDFYKPPVVLDLFRKLERDTVPFQARDGFSWKPHQVFITQDEIDAFLRGGGAYENGRLAIYSFYLNHEDAKERTEFIKERYGTGGQSHALSGADDSHADYDGKGLKLVRGTYLEPLSETLIKWPQVERRIQHLILRGQYLRASDYSKMAGYERRQMASSVVSFYARLPQDIERPWPPETDMFSTRDAVAELMDKDGGMDRILSLMDRALAELPLDSERYAERTDILVKLHQYAEGTYTLFPDQKAASKEQRNGQMSLFDIFDMTEGREEAAPQETEETIPARETLIESESSEEPSEARERDGKEEYSEPEDPGLQIEESVRASNFRITDEELGAGTPKEKFRANLEAIRTLKALQSESRQAAKEEQEILSRYVGWGGLPQAFDPENPSWTEEYAELKGTLTEEEFRQARESTLNAFYTPPAVIREMYEALHRMGLSGGNILEPSCGIGNFMGMVPDSMQGMRMYGVELDPISAGIAKQLYPENAIAAAGFETAQFPDSFFDCVIGNVPFGNYKVADKRYDRYNFMIHDYFIAKSLDLVRPGGVVAVITSSGTMDKLNSSVRQYLAGRADLLGAVRLPNTAFQKNAGTSVVADILFLQKRDRAQLEMPEWTGTGRTEDGLEINSYFVSHPEMVLGKLSSRTGQYGKETVTVLPFEDAELGDLLHEALGRIEGTITEAELTDDDLEEVIDRSIPADPSVRNFSYTLVNDQIYYRENSRMNPVDLPAVTTGRVRGMIELRDITRELLDKQMEEADDDTIHGLQEKLNARYDVFAGQYGLINSSANKRAFSQDSGYCLLASLEILNEQGELERKADIFTKRTIRKAETVTSVDTASEALALSIGEKACVDLEFMEQVSGKNSSQIIDELQGVIFLNPITQKWETSDEYLSGNVREKLRLARGFAKGDPKYGINVQYLEKVQPRDLDASEIEVRLGATWIDPSFINHFMGETFHTPRYFLGDEIAVKYASITGQWQVTGKNRDLGNSLVTHTYGTSRANGYRLLEDALNLRDTKIYDNIRDIDGTERRVLNKKETMLAQQKQEMIRDAFKNWIFKDMDRREQLCSKYNEIFNSIRPREYDGSHINFAGMNPEISLMEHQKNAVAHILYGNNTLLAHCVGAGKTYQMIAAGMESRRLGLAQKCLYVVPNHLTEQWGSDFLRLYPGANILVATKKDFEPANRKKFCSRIATGDYDAVIIGHSQFERIPLSKERQAMTIQRQIDDITAAIDEVKADRGERYTIKQMEKTRKTLQARLMKLNDQSRKDDVVTFEQLGVDRLFVDESHFYKNLFLYTKMRNVAGISQTDAQKSSDMFMKCQYLDEITGGRGITFATGTPISNSMVELYTIMRYLQYDTLQSMGLGHFDSWAASFGETVTAIELSPEGTGYRAKTRFARFYNLPELISVFRETADIQTADMLNLPTPEAEYINEVLKPSETQKDMVQSFAERAEKVRAGHIDPSADNMLKITNDGRKCALDQRLINDMIPDERDTKVNRCAQNVFEIWRETEKDRSAQLVFCDLSTPKSDGTFNVYDDMRKKLILKGIPSEEIAFIHEANTEVRKADLFAKVRTGRVRILLGSTAKLGAGTNIQDRLIALHHLDCPWKPSDLEQQEGRILRQGNRNEKVRIFRYVTEGTFDAYMWQILENKQKFISQIMTSKSPVRSCEDVDEAVLSYAEIKALSTGNPHIKEKMDLDIQVSKLKLMKSEHTSQKYRLETDIARTYPVQITSLKERIAGLTSDRDAYRPFKEEDREAFTMTVCGKEYTEKKEAGTAIIDACTGLRTAKASGQIGNYHGFTISANFDLFLQRYMLTMKRQCSYTVEAGKDPAGNVQRITNALDSIDRQLEESARKLETVQEQLAIAREEVSKPFEKEAELTEKLERLSELNSMLNLDEKGGMENIGIDEEPEETERGDRAFRTAEKEGGMSLKQRLMEKQEQIMASHMVRPVRPACGVEL